MCSVKLLEKLAVTLKRVSPLHRLPEKPGIVNRLKRYVRKEERRVRVTKGGGVPESHVPRKAHDGLKTHGKEHGPKTTTADGQVRNISTGGLRNEAPLTQSQKNEISSYAKSLGVDDDMIVFSDNMNTGYADLFGRETLYVGTDALPATKTGLKANSYVSMKGTLGHEIVGHRAAALAGKTQSVGYLEEAQASIRAARFTPDLSNGERMTLLRDGIGRLKDSGISIRDVKDQLWIKEP